MTRTYFHDLELPNRDVEITVEYSRTPYDPGVTWGPAESCYPPEGGEIEIVSFWERRRKITMHLSSDEEQYVIEELMKLPESEYEPDDPDYWRD